MILRLLLFRRNEKSFVNGLYSYSQINLLSLSSVQTLSKKQYPFEDLEYHSDLHPKQKPVERNFRCNNQVPQHMNSYNQNTPLHYNSVESTKFPQHPDHVYHQRGLDNKMQYSETVAKNRRNDFRPYQRENWIISKQDYFSIVKLLAENGTFPADLSVDVLPYLPIMSLKFNDENDFTQHCLKNWWLSLKKNVRNVQRTSLAKSIIGLEKLNLKTNGLVLKIITWDNIQQLAFVYMSGVHNKTSNKSFHFLLAALTDFVIIHKQKPSDYLKKLLSDCIETYFQSEPYQHNLKYVNPFIGFICEKIILLKIDVPSSSECFKTIITSCWVAVNYNYAQQTFMESSPFMLLINLNKITQAFLTWEMNLDEYHKGFWLLLFVSVECLLRAKIKYRQNEQRNLVLEIFKNFLLVALKFDKIQQFKTVEWFWLQQLKEVLSVHKVCPLTDDMKNDIKIIETIIKNNSNFELFRPVVAELSEIV